MDDGISVPVEPTRLGAVISESEVDVRARISDRQLPLLVDDACASALASFGRTEDLVVSPDGGLLVIAGFDSNRLHLLHFRIGDDGVHVSGVRSADVDGLARPHGLAFLDETTLLVANREAQLSLVRLDECRTNVVSARVLIDGSADVPVRTPGSVAVHRIGENLVEVFVCNNYAHDVTRYVLDGQREWAIVDGERVLAADLEIPDGVAISENGDWIAISNHNRHAVYVYRYDHELTVDSLPAGVLRGVNYPHGLAFADRDRQIVVLDAGLPTLYSFEAIEGDWSGERRPSRIDRVMDDHAFHRGRYNPEEGGSKGLEIVADGVVAVTGEFQPLAFFELGRHEVQPSPPGCSCAGGRTPLLRLAKRAADELADSLRERDELLDELAACRSALGAASHANAAFERQTSDMCAELQLVRGEHADAATEMDRLIRRVLDLEAHIDAIHASRSWRWSSPLRTPSWLWQRVRTGRH